MAGDLPRPHTEQPGGTTLLTAPSLFVDRGAEPSVTFLVFCGA